MTHETKGPRDAARAPPLAGVHGHPRARPQPRTRARSISFDDPRRPTPGPRLRIAVDFDGVLFDHIPYVLRGFRDAHGIDLEAEGLAHWDFFQYRAVREKNLTWSCVKTVLSAIETDPVLHDGPARDAESAHVMRRWRAAGHEVHVVTARDPESLAVTQRFLAANGIPYDELRVGVSLKTGYDVLVDDAPHNVLTAAADGSLALLMDHAYNQDVPTRVNPLRVRDWREVESTVARALDLGGSAPVLGAEFPGRRVARPSMSGLRADSAGKR